MLKPYKDLCTADLEDLQPYVNSKDAPVHSCMAAENVSPPIWCCVITQSMSWAVLKGLVHEMAPVVSTCRCAMTKSMLLVAERGLVS